MKSTFQDFLQFLNRSEQPFLNRGSAWPLRWAIGQSHRIHTTWCTRKKRAWWSVQAHSTCYAETGIYSNYCNKNRSKHFQHFSNFWIIRLKSKFIKMVFFENQNEFSVCLPRTSVTGPVTIRTSLFLILLHLYSFCQLSCRYCCHKIRGIGLARNSPRPLLH